MALVSDIHGNLAALDAVVAAIDADRIDRTICLGDVAATGPQPREVLERVRGLGWPVVMGNADVELLQPGAPEPDVDDDMRKILEISAWAANALDDADRSFLESFQSTVSVDLGAAGRLLCCHGSPRSYNDIIRATTPDDELEPLIAGTEATVQAGGHTHARMLRTWRGREIVNPGSVGLPYEFLPDGSVQIPPWAEFAILLAEEDGALSMEFRRVGYDRGATVRAMYENGMPHAAWWSEGWR